MRRKIKIKLLFILIFLIFNCKLAISQYSPPAGHEGSIAIHKDSSIIERWATKCYVQRGLVKCSDSTLGYTSYGSPENAVGKADNIVVSLGDKGIAVLTFEEPIHNNPGHDFAVFENSFSDDFLELAFVEVSTDSIKWVRFPSISLTQDSVQVSTFGTLDTRLINNLAGKFRALYGTPFDLEELKDSLGIDINNVRYVRIIDVGGSINECPEYDAMGHKINDPWPTPFHTGGFDLDAVAVLKNTISSAYLHNEFLHTEINCIVLQNSKIRILSPENEFSIYLYSIEGNEIVKLLNKFEFSVPFVSPGIYVVKYQSKNIVKTFKIILKN